MKRILCLALLAAMLVCTCLRVSADEAVPNVACELTAPGAAELEENPRARSAKLRVAEKL